MLNDKKFANAGTDVIEYRISAGQEFKNKDPNKSLENIKIANT